MQTHTPGGRAYREDYNWTVLTFKRLHEEGFKLDAYAIKTWAIANEWRDVYADTLAGLADEIDRGVNKRLKRNAVTSLRDDIFDVWIRVGEEVEWSPTAQW